MMQARTKLLALPFAATAATATTAATAITAAAAAALTITLTACAPITDAVSGITSGGSDAATTSKGSPDVTVRPVITQGNGLAWRDAFVMATDPVPETNAAQTEAASMLNRVIATAYPDVAAQWPDLATEFLETACPFDPDPTKLPQADPAAPIVACDSYGTTKYILGPSEASGVDIASVSPHEDETHKYWLIDISFNKTGAPAFGALSGRLSAQPSPESQALDSAFASNTRSARISAAIQLGPAAVLQQAALTRGTVVLTAPVMQAPITDGKLTLSGTFGEEDTKQLAAYLSE